MYCVLSNHMLCSPTRQLLPATKKTYFLLFNIAISFINICDTAIVITYVIHIKDCWTQSNSMYLKVSELTSFKDYLLFLIFANLPITLSPMTAIGQHLLNNQMCTSHYNNSSISIFATACSSSFHFSTLEATFSTTF